MVLKTTWADNIKASGNGGFTIKKGNQIGSLFYLSTDLTGLLFLFVLSFFVSLKKSATNPIRKEAY